MKKTVTMVLCLLLFTGCSGKTEEIDRGMSLRSRLLKAEGCSFDVSITADYGDALREFSLSCQADRSGDMTFTVTAPETISGITGTIGSSGGALTFDGNALQFDLLADGQVSPVSSPWLFLKTLRSGYLTAAGMEGEELRLTIDDTYEEDALKLDIWLNDQDIPVRSEVLYDGRRILTLKVTNFQIL